MIGPHYCDTSQAAMCHHVYIVQHELHMHALVLFESPLEVFSYQNEQRIQIKYSRLGLHFMTYHSSFVNL